MSSCLCAACGYEMIILCCKDRPVYYGFCRPCIERIDWNNIACRSCDRLLDDDLYRVQRQLSFGKNKQALRSSLTVRTEGVNRISNNHQPFKNSRSVNHQPHASSSFLQPQTNQPQHPSFRRLTNQVASQYYSNPFKVNLPQSNNDWYLTEEEVLAADAVVDAPLNLEPFLEKERRKNGIVVPPSSYYESS